MRHFIPLLAALTLCGCGVYECIDAKFERAAQPIDKEFKIELAFQGKEMDMTIKCEKYYDAMCAERGNYWSIREVGAKSQYQTSKFKFNDSELGEVIVPIPQCADLILEKNEMPLKHIVLTIAGEPYWLRSSNGSFRIYSTPAKKASINLNIKINGVNLE